MNVDRNELSLQLRKLRLSRIGEILDHHMQKAADQNLTHLEFLNRLVGDVVLFKREKMIQGRIKQARVPFSRRLEDFDFEFQTSVPEARIQEHAQLQFVEAHDNLIFLGPPGTGKSHLAVGFGLTACQAGYKVRFATTEDLMDQLRLTPGQPVSAARLAPFLTPDLLLLDDFGMQPFDATQAHAFFTLIARRYEKGSIILTSNKAFVDWGKILGGDDVLATAILDRLLHHAHIFNLRGESYRLKNKRNMLKSPRDKPATRSPDEKDTMATEASAPD